MALNYTFLQEVWDNLQKSSHSNGHSSNSSSFQNVGETERIISTAGGALLTWYGLCNKESALGKTIAAAGGALLFRGVTGYCPINAATGRDTQSSKIVEIEKSLTILRPRQEVYQFWRQLENLPLFMTHLEEVRQLNQRHSHWKARAPKDLGHVEWDAEITHEEEGRLLAWQSVADADIHNSGEVRFMDAAGNKGTEIHVKINYRPPAGVLGKGVAEMLNPLLSQIIKDDIRKVKHLLEAGEIPTIEGQPSGRDADY